MSGLINLCEIDISNNLFVDILDILPALQSLPKLNHLIYDFKNE
jgi:hypothetical protein